MRHTILRLAGLLMALALVLTGCNLIEVDPIMQLDEDMAAAKQKYAAVVANYDGGTVTQADVMGSLNSQYNYMSQLYSMYGLNMPANMLSDVEQSVVENAVRNVAVEKQLTERGLSLSEEKLAEVKAEADEHYQSAYDSFYASAAGKTDEVKAKQTEYDLYSAGYTSDAFYAIELGEAQYDLIEETVKGEITEVSDEELQTAYDEKVADDQSQYEGNPGSFESAMSSDSSIVAWMPEGYRTVKHILIKPEEAVLQAVTDARNAVHTAEDKLEDLRDELDALNDDDAEDAEAEAEAEEEAADETEPAEAPRTAEEIQADIDAAEAELETLKADAEKAEADCLASVQDKIDEINGKLEGGETFDALIDEYGEDPGMKNEPTRTRGYYVSANSTTWDANFTAGAMALEKVGDVSATPAISTSGVHIIRYESDVTPGAVALDEIHDALYDDTLEDMKTNHFDESLESWIEALHPEYHLDAFNLD